MKRWSHSKTVITIAFGVILALSTYAAYRSKPVNFAGELPNTIVFEGTLENLGPKPQGVSGNIIVYRLAKYRVERVCQGKYDGSEIVVDHLIFTGDEFKNIKVGDRVCVEVTISKDVLSRYNAEGIRSPSDDIKTFYTAHEEVRSADAVKACCGRQE